jgi:serine/threonine protein kinase/tetratricopeptide (TPR) repeat protein
MIGDTISHYRILEKLGGGGMGVVYKAEDTRLKRTVALKFLKPELTDDEDTRTRFVHEAQAASALQHHNICTIHEIDQTSDGRMFICMDYYGGHTLKARTEGGALPLREAVDIAAQAAEGLAKAHDAGMVHRDIKPANIAITDDGVVKILDFGLAKLTDRTRVTKMGTTVGTVSYMSPEQARGDDVAAGADVWSLGVILYEMLAGRLPFRATHDAAVLYAIINEPYVPVAELREDIPQSLARIVERALTKNPHERYDAAGEMARDLRTVAAEMESSDRQVPETGAPAPKRRTRIWLPMGLVVLIAAIYLLLKPVLFEDELVSAPRPIAVISFENRTGDAQYDYLREAIPNLLITSLEQSKYLSVITWERMHDLLQQAGRGDVTVIDKETGFEVCAMDGVDTIVLGSFVKAGDVFVTDVKILDVHSKELLKSVSAKGDGVGSILDSQIDELGKEISRGVGLSERAITAASPRPIASVTTRSMDAYHYYLQGKEADRKFYWEEARGYLETSVKLDSTFAMAWQALGWVYHKVADFHRSKAAYERALALSSHATEKERLWIEYCYATTIDNDIDKAQRLLLELTDSYPKDKEPLIQLGALYRKRLMFEKSDEAYNKVLALDPENGEAFNGLGYLYAAQDRYEEAIQYFEKYATVNPGDANPYDSMAESYLRMGEFDKAVQMYERALEAKPDFPSRMGIAYVNALREDWSGAFEMQKEFVATSPTRGNAIRGEYMLAYYYYYSCHWRDALETVSKVRTHFGLMGFSWGIAGTHWMESWIRHQMGDYKGCRQSMEKSLSIARAANRESSWLILLSNVALGLTDLKEGMIEAARARLDTVETRLPNVETEDPVYAEVSAYVSSLFRAEVLLAEGEFEDAIAACKSAPHVKMPEPGTIITFFYHFPAERDILARACVEKGAVNDAIAEYERLFTFDPDRKDHRLVYPPLHYRLGLLYEETGMSDKAIQQYEKLLNICGDAEPELVEVSDARRRLAKLHGD